MFSRIVLSSLVVASQAQAVVKCGGLTPLSSSSGLQLYCGAGAAACPAGSYCQIASDVFGPFAVCCPLVAASPSFASATSLPFYISSLTSAPIYASSPNLFAPLTPFSYFGALPPVSAPVYSSLYPANTAPAASQIYYPAPAASQIYPASGNAASQFYVPAPTPRVGDPLVTTTVVASPAPVLCPDGSGATQKNCPLDPNPCVVSSCQGVPGATCMVDYCGNCGPKWFDSNNNVVTDQCNGAAPTQVYQSQSNQAQNPNANLYQTQSNQAQNPNANLYQTQSNQAQNPNANLYQTVASPTAAYQPNANLYQTVGSPTASQNSNSNLYQTQSNQAQSNQAYQPNANLYQTVGSPTVYQSNSNSYQTNAPVAAPVQSQSQTISSSAGPVQFGSQSGSTGSSQFGSQSGSTGSSQFGSQSGSTGSSQFGSQSGCPVAPDCSLQYLNGNNTNITQQANATAAQKQEISWQLQAQQTHCQYQNPVMDGNGCMVNCGTLVCNGPVRFLQITVGQDSAVATWVAPLSAAAGQTYFAGLSYDGQNWRNLPLEQPSSTFARFQVNQSMPFEVRVTANGYPSAIQAYIPAGSNYTFPNQNNGMMMMNNQNNGMMMNQNNGMMNQNNGMMNNGQNYAMQSAESMESMESSTETTTNV